MNIRPENKTYVHITLLKTLKLYTLYVKTPRQITYSSAMHKNQTEQPVTNFDS